MLDGSSLLPVPADQVEAAAAFGIGAVGDDAEVAHPIAVTEQLALARADADGEIAPRRDRVLLPDAVAGQVINLGPLADRVGLVLVSFPVVFGQRGDAFSQLPAHIGRNGIADRLLVEPAHQIVLVQRTVPAQIELPNATG